jgi:hypothetical protein
MITVAIDTPMGMMNELTQVAMSDMMPCQGTHSVISYDMWAERCSEVPTVRPADPWSADFAGAIAEADANTSGAGVGDHPYPDQARQSHPNHS